MNSIAAPGRRDPRIGSRDSSYHKMRDVPFAPGSSKTGRCIEAVDGARTVRFYCEGLLMQTHQLLAAGSSAMGEDSGSRDLANALRS